MPWTVSSDACQTWGFPTVCTGTLEAAKLLHICLTHDAAAIACEATHGIADLKTARVFTAHMRHCSLLCTSLSKHWSSSCPSRTSHPSSPYRIALEVCLLGKDSVSTAAGV